MEKLRNNKGFTLIELLLVIVIISILAGIILGASSYIVRVARIKRLEVTKTVLKTAIHRYHAEYNEWPLEATEKEIEDGVAIREGKENAEVFGALRITNTTRNPDGIRFLDETTVLTCEKDLPVPLVNAEKGDKPLVYINREGKVRNDKGEVNYFKVVFNLEIDTVEVEAPNPRAENDN